jgi:glutamate dehydrogenase
VQNRSGWPWTEAEVHERLRSLMVDAFDSVSSVAEEEKLDLRAAAYQVALRRLEAAIGSSTRRPAG